MLYLLHTFPNVGNNTAWQVKPEKRYGNTIGFIVKYFCCHKQFKSTNSFLIRTITITCLRLG